MADKESDAHTARLALSRQRTAAELDRVRGALGFPSSQELRQRVAGVLTNALYDVPAWSSRRRFVQDEQVQTDDRSTRDVGVTNGEAVAETLVERTQELDQVLRIPRPSEFPILTAAQLSDAEARVSLLLRRIEQELETVAEEERLQKKSSSSFATYGSTMFLSNDDWNAKMKKLVGTRLELRHGGARDHHTVMDWCREKQDIVASPLRSRMATSDTNAAPSSQNSSTRASMAKAMAPPMYPQLLQSMNQLQQQVFAAHKNARLPPPPTSASAATTAAASTAV